jgi:hypothetical protein
MRSTGEAEGFQEGQRRVHVVHDVAHAWLAAGLTQ